MKANHEYKSLKSRSERVLKLIEKFIEEYEDKGYLEYTENIERKLSIDVRIGDETYTFAANLHIAQKRIMFNVYYWEFDLSKPNRFRQDLVEELRFYIKDDNVIFIANKYLTPLQIGGIESKGTIEAILQECENHTGRIHQDDSNLIEESIKKKQQQIV